MNFEKQINLHIKLILKKLLPASCSKSTFGFFLRIIKLKCCHSENVVQGPEGYFKTTFYTGTKTYFGTHRNTPTA
jgi:hypothetical protein